MNRVCLADCVASCLAHAMRIVRQRSQWKEHDDERRGGVWTHQSAHHARLVAEQRQRQESGDQANRLTPEQVGLIEGLTGIKAEYDTPHGTGAPAGR